jgi:hypothetical protein
VKCALLLAVVLSLSGCFKPAPACATDCALILAEPASDADCRTFLEADFKARLTFAADLGDLPDFAPQHLCLGEAQFTVHVHPGDGGPWPNPSEPSEWVSGLADCRTGTVEVADRDWAHNALAHELVHLAQGCAFGSADLPHHFGPDTARIYEAIHDAQEVPLCF